METTKVPAIEDRGLDPEDERHAQRTLLSRKEGETAPLATAWTDRENIMQ